MDWNGDGLLDIIVGDRDGYVSYFERTGSGVDDLTAAGHITASGTAINVSANSAPVVVDWNNDGLLDLLVANESSTQGIRLYLNSGTTSVPVLTTWSYIQSSGSDIKRYRCCPQVYDMNGDGKKDLIMGENDARIYYYENTGTDAAPAFSGYETIQSNGSPLDLYYGTRLWVNDWDENGIPDLLVSDYNGFVYVFMADLSGVSEEATDLIQTGFAVVPAVNPAVGNFNLNVQTPMGGSIELRVYDSAGRLVATKNASGMSDGLNLVVVDAGSLATGVYTVVAASGSDISTCRMVLTN
ncbi:MAG: FG-GAP-like repeat-containing protein [Candidatus Fermentibacteria bacterium]|nr:FG-GAP-like repeat-containing protein [Candidatus Fermentibacteria bacterium]